MKQYPLVQVGNPDFRKATSAYSKEEILNKKIQAQVARMKFTMRRVHGVGLAAPQIGVQKQLFVMRLKPTKFRPHIHKVEPYAVFNPEIITSSKKSEKDWEGCFSVANAGLFAAVTRPDTITVRYLNESAEEVTCEIRGLEARVFQHEYDHLYGEIFLEKDIDPMSMMSAEEYRLMREHESK